MNADSKTQTQNREGETMDARLKEAIEKAGQAMQMAAADIKEAHRIARQTNERFAEMLLRDQFEPACRIVSRLAEMEE